MDVSLARKKELEEKDPFQEKMEKWIELAKEYKTQIIAVVTAILVVWFSIVFYLYYKNNQEKGGLAALQKVSAELNLETKKDTDKFFQKAKKGYEGVIKDFGSTVAGKMAMTQLADLLYNKKEYDKAIAHYKNALDGFEGTSVENLILTNLALSYEQKKDTENAKITFQKIIAGTSLFKKDEAYYHLGMIYEKEKKTKESIDMFSKIKQTSIYRKLIEDKL